MKQIYQVFILTFITHNFLMAATNDHKNKVREIHLVLSQFDEPTKRRHPAFINPFKAPTTSDIQEFAGSEISLNYRPLWFWYCSEKSLKSGRSFSENNGWFLRNGPKQRELYKRFNPEEKETRESYKYRFTESRRNYDEHFYQALSASTRATEVFVLPQQETPPIELPNEIIREIFDWILPPAIGREEYYSKIYYSKITELWSRFEKMVFYSWDNNDGFTYYQCNYSGDGSVDDDAESYY